MKLPILKMLKKREYSELALFQDTVIMMLYQIDSTIILHGGTCVWRCFNGSRFSNDIDIYLKSRSNLENLKRNVLSVASDYDIKVEKIKDTGHLIFIAFSFGNIYLKVEINYIKKDLHPVATRFEKVDSTYTEVLALTPEDLILEKIAAYSHRLFIRDIYDIYILCDYVQEKAKIKNAVINFIQKIKQPVNEEDLKVLIYEGPIPSFRNMIEYIKGRFA
ncbi:MAG: nucleotidyl transferase AbiEii/AbiGii toxin family protein [Candidatus Marsarchaeota archaeon]|nr:nucleotidyl transferase AbiEii/AbiGii toxin family protein [Candidatus Marsarchaeota archaeon]MCL5094655.1 nucleotidyl transferase AbiEii/AbiGii toxin family protein [Candidatus Marsarchaeota archaeon]